MKRLDGIAIVLGIIGFIGTLVSWKIDNETAFNVTLVLLSISILFLIARFIFNFFSRSEEQELEIRRHLTETLWISSDKRNRQSVSSSFLNWDECTLLLWIHIPRRGEGLRNAPHNKYIIAHQTGDGGISGHLNAFFLRYSSQNTWDFLFSNPRGEIPRDDNRFRLEDGLEPGWHRIQISWNHSIPLLTLLIDGGERINIRYQHHLNYWPREFEDSVYIGAWVNQYPESYCDTQLAHFWICNKYLDATDDLVHEHRTIAMGDSINRLRGLEDAYKPQKSPKTSIVKKLIQKISSFHVKVRDFFQRHKSTIIVWVSIVSLTVAIMSFGLSQLEILKPIWTPSIRVVNNLENSVSIFINNKGHGKVDAKSSKVFSVDQFPVEVTFITSRVKISSGAYISDSMRGTWYSVKRGDTIDVNPTVSGQMYFYPIVTNELNTDCSITINEGLISANTPGAVVGSSKTVKFGYYKLFRNSNVVFKCDDGMTYWWGERNGQMEQETPLYQKVNENSGVVYLTLK